MTVENTDIYMCVCVCVCVYICMCVCVCMYVYVCVCVCVYIYITVCEQLHEKYQDRRFLLSFSTDDISEDTDQQFIATYVYIIWHVYIL